MTDETNDFLGDNLSGETPDTPVKPVKVVKGAKAATAKPQGERMKRIMLEDNDEIPPGGQFIQVNGRSFLLQPGVEVDVPACVVDVLDHAITSVPVRDRDQSVIGYRDRLRFPYRLITRRGSRDED